MITFRLLRVEFCRNPSEFSLEQIPAYDLYLIPYCAIIILQNLHECHAKSEDLPSTFGTDSAK